jgi:hypothetical protein
MVRFSVSVTSIVHLKILESQFSCLNGRTTRRCEFDHKQFKNTTFVACVAHTTYLNVCDVTVEGESIWKKTFGK